VSGVKVMIRTGAGGYRAAELPHDVTMRRLIPALATRLDLPILDSDGQPIGYRLIHEGREVGPEQTLRQAGVQDGAVIDFDTDVAEGERQPSDPLGLLLAKQIQVQPNSVTIPIASAEDLKQFPPLVGSRQVAVILWDLVSVCIRPSVKLPADVRMRQLLPLLAQVLGVAMQFGDDALDAFDYELRLKGGRTILDHESLEGAGVQYGDTLFFLLGARREPESTIKDWTCAGCGRRFPQAWPHCPACGTADARLRPFCAACGGRLPPYPDILFCPTCGSPLPPSG
jgi:hypothetical protein